MKLWIAYLIFYTIITLVYLSYRYIILASVVKEHYKPFNAKVSVIIPYYNEDFNILRKTIKFACKAEGNKEVLVIDDGSKINYSKKLKKLQKKYDFKLFRYKQNQGKRYAQVYGIKRSSGDIIVMIDSDTMIMKKGILNLIKPFSDKLVGATTGNILVANEKQNWLTRMISARYWVAFNQERKSQSALGVVTCCGGPFSAYRRKYIMPLLDKYLNQEFLGKKCTYGDDRHLTNLLLKNYKIKYVENARAYTFVPVTLRSYIKQQIRWKKSFIRESLITMKYMWKRSKWLTFDQGITFALPFLALFVRLNLYYIAFFIYPPLLIWFVFIIIIMALLRSLLIMWDSGKKVIYNIGYGFLHEICIYWLLFYSLFTLKDTSWGTR